MNYFLNRTYIENRWYTWYTPTKYLFSLETNREPRGTHAGTHRGTHPSYLVHIWLVTTNINSSLGELS